MIQIRKSKKTTEGFMMGKLTSEGDTIFGYKFSDYFEDFIKIKTQIDNNNFIVIGRKGSGKTAYVKFLKNHIADSNGYWRVLQGTELGRKNIEQLNIKPDELYMDQWFEWLVLMKLAQMIIESGAFNYTKEGKAVKKFVDNNPAAIGMDGWEDRMRNNEAQTEVGFNPLKQFGTKWYQRFRQEQTRAPFYKIIDLARKSIIDALHFDIGKQMPMLVMFDDFDITYRLSDTSSPHNLISLLRIAMKYNTEYLSGTQAKIIVFMRDDFYSSLSGIEADGSKTINSFKCLLDWYQHCEAIQDEKQIPLRKLINNRIRLNFNNKGYNIEHPDDPWLDFVEERGYGQRSIFKSLLDYTFYRPRDVIALFQNIGNYTFQLPLNEENIRQILRESVRNIVGDFQDELSTYYTKVQVDSIFEILRDCYRSGIQGTEYKKIAQSIIDKQLPNDTFERLLNYGLIIPRSRNRRYYLYREDMMIEEYENVSFELPKCVYEYYSQKFPL